MGISEGMFYRPIGVKTLILWMEHSGTSAMTISID
jgi:hypothetical protein